MNKLYNIYIQSGGNNEKSRENKEIIFALISEIGKPYHQLPFDDKRGFLQFTHNQTFIDKSGASQTFTLQATKDQWGYSLVLKNNGVDDEGRFSFDRKKRIDYDDSFIDFMDIFRNF